MYINYKLLLFCVPSKGTFLNSENYFARLYQFRKYKITNYI